MQADVGVYISHSKLAKQYKISMVHRSPSHCLWAQRTTFQACLGIILAPWRSTKVCQCQCSTGIHLMVPRMTMFLSNSIHPRVRPNDWLKISIVYVGQNVLHYPSTSGHPFCQTRNFIYSPPNAVWLCHIHINPFNCRTDRDGWRGQDLRRFRTIFWLDASS